MDNVKNTWKELGSIITNKVETSNIFNNYFATIAEKVKVNINPSLKNISDFLKSRTQNSFFISLTNKSEIQNIISSLDPNKPVEPNSISKKILTLLNNISSQLADIFNISFSTGVFPTILKVTKFAPVCNSKSEFTNYRPISLLCNIKKMLEKLLMYNKVYNFFTKNNLIYPL